MKKLFTVFVLLSLFFGGCVIITIPGAGPLAEKTIGGKGVDKVLIMDISGIITEEPSTNILGVETSPNIAARVKEELTLATEDKDVKALVLRINTPGGSVTTCDIISHEIKNFKKKRNIPVIAELMDVAASGGYYVAAASDRIIAHPTTVTGSIGVIAYNVNASGLMEKIGITNQTVKSGDKKDIGSPLRPMTEEERKILQSVINGMYERFLDVIVEGRKGITRDELTKIADGRIYNAGQALELKLIDGIGYLDDAVEAAKGAAGVKEAKIITYAQPKSYRNNIYSSLEPRLSPEIRILNISAMPLYQKFGLSFMYLWMP